MTELSCQPNIYETKLRKIATIQIPTDRFQLYSA